MGVAPAMKGFTLASLPQRVSFQGSCRSAGRRNVLLLRKSIILWDLVLPWDRESSETRSAKTDGITMRGQRGPAQNSSMFYFTARVKRIGSVDNVLLA